jgi:hypothetical protein
VLNVVRLNVVRLSVVRLSVVMLNVVLLSVVMLNVVLLSVVAPQFKLKLKLNRKISPKIEKMKTIRNFLFR